MSEALGDEYIRRAVRYAQASDTEAAKLASGLRKIHDKLLKTITREYGTLTASQLSALTTVIQNAIATYYKDNAIPTVEALAAKAFEKELTWGMTTLGSFIGESVVEPGRKAAYQKALSTPYQGRTFKRWFSRAGAANSDYITRALAAEWMSGSGSDAARRVVFNAMQRGERDIKTLTRSYLQHMSTQARETAMAAYAEHLDGYTWSSVLDNRTTPLICGIRDQLDYTVDHKPIGHSLEWGAGPGRAHFNCRSQSVPRVKDDKRTLPRAAVSAGKNYDRGDNVTATGKVRKPTKQNRQAGIFKIEETTTRTRYEGWLRRQPTDFIADVLGNAERATAFKAGKSLSDYLPASGLGAVGAVGRIDINNL